MCRVTCDITLASGMSRLGEVHVRVPDTAVGDPKLFGVCLERAMKAFVLAFEEGADRVESEIRIV